MATYQYECSKCRKPFTIDMSFKEHDRHRLVECPKCKSKVTSQVLTAAHVQTANKS